MKLSTTCHQSSDYGTNKKCMRIGKELWKNVGLCGVSRKDKGKIIKEAVRAGWEVEATWSLAAHAAKGKHKNTFYFFVCIQGTLCRAMNNHNASPLSLSLSLLPHSCHVKPSGEVYNVLSWKGSVSEPLQSNLSTVVMSTIDHCLKGFLYVY